MNQQKKTPKPIKHVLHIISLLKCAVHWFKNDIPIFSFPDFIFENGIVAYKSYENKNRYIYDNLTTYLLQYDVNYTKYNSPFLVYNDFVWKEDIFYSRHIPLDYIIREETSMGPKGCQRCRKYYKQTYKVFLKYCSKCTEKLN